MSIIRNSFLCFALGTVFVAPQVNAMGSKPTKPTNPQQPPKETGDALVRLGISFAMVYAKNDKKYNTILNSLGLNSPEDLQAFLTGNSNGTNFGNIISNLVLQAAVSNSEASQILQSLGITDLKQLREFINAKGGGFDYNRLLEIALAQAGGSSKYTVWLRTIGIKDIQDIKNLLKGTKQGGNLKSLVVVFANDYVKKNPKYQEYAVYIEAAMIALGLYQGADGTGVNGGSDDDIINLGPYNGMTVGETKAASQKL